MGNAIKGFGCMDDIKIPYFILYNKFTGLIRFYVYLNTDQSYSAVATTLSARIATPVTGGAKDILNAPDSYLEEEVNKDDDITVYITDLNSNSNWAVGEFQSVFDPYFENSLYEGKSLQFKVLGILSQAVELNGKSLVNGFSISGKTSEVLQKTEKKDDFNIIATGKSLKEFSSSIKDFKKSVKEAKDEFKETDKGVIKDIVSGANDLFNGDNAFSYALTSISALTGVGGAALKIVGGITGFFSSNSARVSVPAAPKPHGYFTATGIADVLVQIPGTQHMGTANRPFYDCPLGIINIAKTPILEATVIERRVYDINKFIYGSLSSPTPPTIVNKNYEWFATYKPKLALEAILNKSTGLELVSAEAALVAEVSDEDLFRDHIESFVSNDRAISFYINHMLTDLESGITEINQLDPSKMAHKIQTPWVSISCFNNSSFTVLNKCKVYIAFRAILRKPGSGDKDPIIVQNYYLPIIEENEPLKTYGSVNEIRNKNGDIIKVASNNIPPNGTSPILSIVSNAEVKTRPKKDTYANYKVYTNGAISLTINDNRKFVATGNIDLYTPIEDGVQEDKYFEVPNGATFEAYIEDRRPDVSCEEPINITQISGNCGYDNSAIRSADQDELIEVEKLNAMTVYPNPTKDKFTLNIKSIEMANASVSIFDVLGNEILKLNTEEVKEGAIEVNMQGQPAGIYLIKMISGKEIVTQKVVLSK